MIESRVAFSGGFTSNSLVYLEAVSITVSLSRFVNNRVSFAVANVAYKTDHPENLTGNVLADNSKGYDIFIGLSCRPASSLSLGNSRCIQCSDNWHHDLLGIMVAASVVGMGLVIFMLALNMTIAIGTLNGILFYANIIAASANTFRLLKQQISSLYLFRS